MKKLLIFLVPLAFVLPASADLILTINGSPAPDEIYLAGPSASMELDVELTAGESILGYDLSIIVSNPQGVLDSSSVILPPIPPWMLIPYVVEDYPQKFRWTAGDYPGMPGHAGPIVLMSGLMFHCEEATPVTIELVSASSVMLKEEGGQWTDYQAGYIFDRISVTQIPEPATMLLLGLGGLFLRRRK